MTIQLVGVQFMNYDGFWGDNVYNYLNKFEIPLGIGDNVAVKVRNGGSEHVRVCSVKTISKDVAKQKYKGYKFILENLNLRKLDKPTLLEDHCYVYDIRIWRNQWSSDGGYEEQWSDLVKTAICDVELNYKDSIAYEGSKAKIVNIRQMPISKTEKMDKVIRLAEAPKKKRKVKKSSSNTWYKKSWFIILMLILFFPVGLYLMWRHANWNKYIKIIVSTIILLIYISNL